MIGTGQGKFEPGRFATREELAVVLWNFEQYLKKIKESDLIAKHD